MILQKKKGNILKSQKKRKKESKNKKDKKIKLNLLDKIDFHGDEGGVVINDK